MIDYIAVDNRLRREVEDAKVVRGLFSDSDHFAVVAKVRMRERWEFKGNGRKEGERRELASEKLRNSEESQRYERRCRCKDNTSDIISICLSINNSGEGDQCIEMNH